jgi:Fructose/tagatose bisphosphate aldolase
LVLHGGSQIPEEQIIKSIGFGISKININTELQIVYANALKEYMEINNLDENRNYDPRKINKFAMQKMKEVLIEKFKVFNSINKAK